MLYDMREDYRRPERGFFNRPVTIADCAAASLLGFILGTVIATIFAAAMSKGLMVPPSDLL